MRDFAGRALPEPGVPTGYAAIIQHYALRTALPPRLAALAGRHHPGSTPSWLMLTPRHRPAQTLAGQLAFAFKWEGVDLGVLAALFEVVEDSEIADIVSAAPTGAVSRRFWYLHEWLTGRTLDVANPGKVRAAPVLDPNLQRAAPRGLDPVIAAASIGFGFVYIHPFEDGNGRLHRWLFHHVLSRAHYNPTGVVFPISSAIERRIEDYKAVLDVYSAEVLPLIDWRPTPDGHVEVLSETANYYRYFDATPHAEFLYACVAQTVEKDLPEEVRFLESYDRFALGVQQVVDMPERKVDLLRSFLAQNSGRLSKRALTDEFSALTAIEIEAIETTYAEAFASEGDRGHGRARPQPPEGES